MALSTRFSVTPASDISNIQNTSSQQEDSAKAIPMESATNNHNKCNEYLFHQTSQTSKQLSRFDSIVEQSTDSVAPFFDMKAMTKR